MNCCDCSEDSITKNEKENLINATFDTINAAITALSQLLFFVLEGASELLHECFINVGVPIASDIVSQAGEGDQGEAEGVH